MKKVLSFVLSVVMVLSVSTAVFAQSEPSDWAVNEVDYKAADFLSAAMNEDIDYTKTITREEFAIVSLYLYLSVSGMELGEMSVENPFTDCNSPFVAIAYGLGLVKGVSDKEFMPEESVTREQMCVMLMRIAEKLVPDFNMEQTKPYLPTLDSFADGSQVSDWAKDYVRLTVSTGLVKGTDENKLNPLGNLTVQEALIVAKRALNIELNF